MNHVTQIYSNWKYNKDNVLNVDYQQNRHFIVFWNILTHYEFDASNTFQVGRGEGKYRKSCVMVKKTHLVQHDMID